ncbi:hypothetical protein JKP88DRAFT_324150 [Tribonema minus]|uniref:Uncharacterized protein n=1 Tax=Tribonema minus TaxID=303371 RepID=A0A835YZT6_9STRA|nr:hypothetical protein JKP88DRAFT_324150 [Tribonema minus]
MTFIGHVGPGLFLSAWGLFIGCEAFQCRSLTKARVGRIKGLLHLMVAKGALPAAVAGVYESFMLAGFSLLFMAHNHGSAMFVGFHKFLTPMLQVAAVLVLLVTALRENRKAAMAFHFALAVIVLTSGLWFITIGFGFSLYSSDEGLIGARRDLPPHAPADANADADGGDSPAMEMAGHDADAFEAAAQLSILLCWHMAAAVGLGRGGTWPLAARRANDGVGRARSTCAAPSAAARAAARVQRDIGEYATLRRCGLLSGGGGAGSGSSSGSGGSSDACPSPDRQHLYEAVDRALAEKHHAFPIEERSALSQTAPASEV